MADALRSGFFRLPEVWYTCAMRAPEWLRTMPTLAVRIAEHRWLVLTLLTVLALALRLIRIAYQPLWWDEGWSLYFATTSIGNMMELTAVDIHPPLYYLLLHFWIRLLGPGIVSVRLLSVLIGTATVPLLYAAGRRLSGHRGGLLAAFLLAISPFHVYYSQEVRMYGLVTLLGLAALTCTTRWDAREGFPGVIVWVGYVLTATAALYTAYYAAFLLLALNLYVLIRWLRSRREWPLRRLGAWIGAQVAVFLLFLPWLWYAGGKLLTYVQFKVDVEEDPILGPFAYLGRHLSAFGWGHAEGFLADWWWVGLLPLLALLLALGFVLWRQRSGGEEPRLQVGAAQSQESGGPSPAARPSPAPGLPLIVLVAVLICGFVVNLTLPFAPPRSERLLLLALPAYLMLFAMGILVLTRYRRWLAAATAGLSVILALVSLGFYYTVPRYADDDYRPLVEQVRALGLPGDVVLGVHPWQVGYFQAYIPDDDARPTLALTPRQVLPEERQLWADDPELMAMELDRLLGEHGRLWFPDHRSMGRMLESAIEAHLVEHAYPVLDEWYGENTVLSLFAADDPEAQPVSARFGEWLRLEGAAVNPDPVEGGWGITAVDLAWQLEEQPDEDYVVGLRLVGPSGQVWAQRDAAPRGGLEPFAEWPVGETQMDHHGLLVPAGTPPGEYTLTARVYRGEDLDVVPVTFAGGSGGEVTLGTVHVIRPEASPPVEALDLEKPLQVDFDERLRLLGYNLPDEAALLPGEAVSVDLFWQAQADPAQDYYPRLQLLDTQGAVLAELAEKPVAGTYPTAWWRAGELVRDPHALPIPATVPPGSYRLVLSLVRADGSEAETARGQRAVELGQIQVEGREPSLEPTEPEHAQVAGFGTSVALTGYDLREVVRAPGSPLEVTLHWHVLETPDRNYHTFVHLLDANGDILAQDDGPPGGGRVPAMGWLPGEYLIDEHSLWLPPDLADGEYRLGVGFYDPVSGVRLGDRVFLDTPVPVSAGEGCLCP
jgi:4-amino-4-deoxy-L-arabinose transferase-like glycosyltransferase